MLSCLKIAVFLFILGAFLYINVSSVDPDLGWHVRTGERIVETTAVPRLDEFSHTMPGQRWVDHEWLQDAGLWWLKSHGLWWLAVLVFALIAALPFGVWLLRSREPMEVLFILLAAFLTSKLAGVRPQLVSFLFFFIAFEMLSSYFSTRTKRFARGAGLIVLFWLWANLHAGFAAGLLLWLVYLGAHRAERLWRGESLAGFWSDFALLTAAGGITLVNPYGWELHYEVWRTLTSFETGRYILEWQPALSVFDPSALLWLFLGAFLFLFGRYWRRLDLASLAVTLVFFAAFLKSARLAPLFFVTALPVAAQGVQALGREVRLIREAQPLTRRERGVLKGIGAGLFLIVFGFFGWAAFSRPAAVFPEKAVTFVREHMRLAGGRLLNEYGWGGYLIEQAPEIKVFIDGRMPHWQGEQGQSAMQDYVAIFYGKDDEAAKEALGRRAVTTVFIRNEKRAAQKEIRDARSAVEKFFIRIGRALAKNPKRDVKTFLTGRGWRVLYEDELAAVLEK